LGKVYLSINNSLGNSEINLQEMVCSPIAPDNWSCTYSYNPNNNAPLGYYDLYITAYDLKGSVNQVTYHKKFVVDDLMLNATWIGNTTDIYFSGFMKYLGKNISISEVSYQSCSEPVLTNYPGGNKDMVLDASSSSQRLCGVNSLSPWTCTLIVNQTGNYTLPTVNHSDPVLSWKFDGTSDFSDSSGRSHNATNFGSTYSNQGKYGGARVFDGVNDYIKGGVPNIGSSGITIEFWAKLSSPLSSVNTESGDLCPFDSSGYQVCFTRDGYIQAVVYGNSTTWEDLGLYSTPIVWFALCRRKRHCMEIQWWKKLGLRWNIRRLRNKGNDCLEWKIICRFFGAGKYISL
jgi:hypothetical protein